MKNKYIAMIPARMGSQRIPKKNARFLCGKPLINYPIELALKTDKLDSVWINTEHDGLGNYAVTQGINFHKRPEELSSNTATNRDFTYEFLKKHDCDYVIMINPTSPALTVETLEAFIDFVDSNDYDTVMSVMEERTESFYQGEKINFDGIDKINSQFLEPVCKIVWAITAWKKEYFIETEDSGKNPIFGNHLGLFPIPKNECPDLDTEEDWKIAEAVLLSRLNENQEYKYLDI